MKSIRVTALASLFFLSSCVHSPTKVQDYVDTEKAIPFKPGPRTPAASDIDWWAANGAQVKNANCRNKLPVTTAEIESYYKKYRVPDGDEAGNIEILGIELVGENPNLVLALMKLLLPADEYQKIENAPKSFQERFRINPSCKKALCAAQKIFGNDVGPQMLFLAEKFGINTSPYSFTNADFFTPSEIADVIRTFELVHKEQLPLKFNQQLIRFKRGYTRASYGAENGVVANATIELFDNWTNQDSVMRQYSLYHEFAHNYSDNQFSDYDRSTTWLNLSGWKETKKGEFDSARKTIMKGHPFVSRYGQENPFEDFAESITSYRFNPALLKRKSENKYNLIKTYVFDGIEFTSPQSCNQRPLTKISQSDIQKQEARFGRTEKDAIKKSCSMSFYQTFLGNTPLSFFDSCVNYEATVIWAKTNSNPFPELTPQGFFDPRLRVSNLQFPKLREELVSELAPEAADWMLDKVSIYSHNMNSQMTNAEYCDVWASLSNSVYPVIDYDNKWRKNGIFINKEFQPRAGAARGICLDLIHDYVPSRKTTTKSIWNWFKRNTYIPSSSQVSERGITRETLLKYILERSKY